MKNNMNNYLNILNNQGISTSTIIAESGVGRTQFYAILNGESVPKLTTANKIAKALKVDITELFPELKEKGMNNKIS